MPVAGKGRGRNNYGQLTYAVAHRNTFANDIEKLRFGYVNRM